MNGLRLGWLFLEGLFIIGFLYFGSVAAFGMAILLLLVPICSIPVNFYVRKHVHAELTVQSSVQKGKNGSFTLKIINDSFVPVFRVRCRIRTENQLNGEESSQDLFTWAAPKGKKAYVLQAGSEYCGSLRIQIPEIRFYDYFGLFGIGKSTEIAGRMNVLPDTFDTEIHLIPSPGSSDDSEIYSQERPGSDLSEIYQIRDYVAGDSPRQIHWKLSSKFDKVVVKDPSFPITRNVLVFWERTGESGNLELIDTQAEVLVSVCRNLLEQSVQFTIGWNDTETNQCVFLEIRDMDELIGMISRILRARGVKEGISGADLLIQTEHDHLYGHMIYIAEEPQSSVMELQQYGKLSLLLCGNIMMEGALLFDGKNYQEQLMRIEL